MKQSQWHLDTPAKVADFWRGNIAPSPIIQHGKEHAVVIPMDAQERAVGWHLVAMGGSSGVDVDFTAVLRPVIICGMKRFLFLHNHPTGIITPSLRDVRFTARLKEVAHLMAMEMIDHIIIGDGTEKYFSFLEPDHAEPPPVIKTKSTEVRSTSRSTLAPVLRTKSRKNTTKRAVR